MSSSACRRPSVWSIVLAMAACLRAMEQPRGMKTANVYTENIASIQWELNCRDSIPIVTRLNSRGWCERKHLLINELNCRLMHATIKDVYHGCPKWLHHCSLPYTLFYHCAPIHRECDITMNLSEHGSKEGFILNLHDPGSVCTLNMETQHKVEVSCMFSAHCPLEKKQNCDDSSIRPTGIISFRYRTPPWGIILYYKVTSELLCEELESSSSALYARTTTQITETSVTRDPSVLGRIWTPWTNKGVLVAGVAMICVGLFLVVTALSLALFLCRSNRRTQTDETRLLQRSDPSTESMNIYSEISLTGVPDMHRGSKTLPTEGPSGNYVDFGDHSVSISGNVSDHSELRSNKTIQYGSTDATPYEYSQVNKFKENPKQSAPMRNGETSDEYAQVNKLKKKGEQREKEMVKQNEGHEATGDEYAQVNKPKKKDA